MSNASRTRSRRDGGWRAGSKSAVVGAGGGSGPGVWISLDSAYVGRGLELLVRTQEARAGCTDMEILTPVQFVRIPANPSLYRFVERYAEAKGCAPSQVGRRRNPLAR